MLNHVYISLLALSIICVTGDGGWLTASSAFECCVEVVEQRLDTLRFRAWVWKDGRSLQCLVEDERPDFMRYLLDLGWQEQAFLAEQ